MKILYVFNRVRVSRRASFIISFFIYLGIIAIVFGRAVGHEFVWDDLVFVKYKDAYRGFNFKTIFFSLSANRLEYLPIRDLTYILDFALWGASPAGFHLSNLIFYFLTLLAALLFTTRLAAFIIKATGAGRNSNAMLVGFLAVALFAVHPINAEAVNFVTCRNVLVSGMFFFFACYAYLVYLGDTKGKKAIWYIASVLCFVLALFSKATSIFLPLVLLLINFLAPASRGIFRWLGLLPFAFISGVGFFVFQSVAKITHTIPAHTLGVASSFWTKVSTSIQIPMFYMLKILAPRGFSPDYGTELFASDIANRYVLLSFLVVAAAVCYAVLAKRRFPALTFSVGWFLAALIPVLNIFPTYPVVADRYAFLPSYAIFFLVAVGGARFCASWPRHGVVIVTGLLLGLGSLSFQQSAVWKSKETLWEHTIKVSPNSTKALSNLGRFYFIEQKEYYKGLEYFKRAREVDPMNPNYDLFLGGLFIIRNDHRNAIVPLFRALALDNQRMETLINLGVVYEALGETEKAREYYRRAAFSTQADPAGNLRERARADLRRLGD